MNAASKMKLKLADKIGYSKRRKLSDGLRHEIKTDSCESAKGIRNVNYSTVEYNTSRTPPEVLRFLAGYFSFVFHVFGYLSTGYPVPCSRNRQPLELVEYLFIFRGVMWPVDYPPRDPLCMSLLSSSY